MLKVVVITAEWNFHKKRVEEICRELERQGISCIVRNYSDELELLIKYCIKNGLIKLPKILVIVNDKVVKVIDEVELDKILLTLKEVQESD